MKARVSVIIPSYNDARYVRMAVESVIRQTYDDIEIIVIDDGSTDETSSILSEYVAQNKIRYIYQNNKGLSGARNAGIKESTGDFVAFLDADDEYLPEKIWKQLDYFSAYPDASIVICRTKIFFNDDTQNLFTVENPSLSGGILETLKKGNFINVNTALIRTDFLRQSGLYFDETLKKSEDWDFWIRMAIIGAKFQCMDDLLVLTRIRSGSLQAGLVSQRMSSIRVYRKNFGRVPMRFYKGLLYALCISVLPQRLQTRLINFFRNTFKYKPI